MVIHFRALPRNITKKNLDSRSISTTREARKATSATTNPSANISKVEREVVSRRARKG